MGKNAAEGGGDGRGNGLGAAAAEGGILFRLRDRCAHRHHPSGEREISARELGQGTLGLHEPGLPSSNGLFSLADTGSVPTRLSLGKL
jgi:hypothetical protein